MRDNDLDILEKSDLSLLETLDHVLGRGLVISGDITISVANVDLIYLGLNILVGSVETIREVLERSERSDVPLQTGAPVGPKAGQ